MSIDWLASFANKFEGNRMLATLEEKKFHGKVTVNFCDGSPQKVHLEYFIKPSTVDITQKLSTSGAG